MNGVAGTEPIAVTPIIRFSAEHIPTGQVIRGIDKIDEGSPLYQDVKTAIFSLLQDGGREIYVPYGSMNPEYKIFRE